MWLLRVIRHMVLIRRLQVDERAMRQFGPVIGERPLGEPAKRLVIISVTALVTDEAVPFLVDEFLPDPLHAARVKSNRGMGNVVEHRTADAFPLVGLLPTVVAIAGQNPRYGVALPAGD